METLEMIQGNIPDNPDRGSTAEPSQQSTQTQQTEPAAPIVEDVFDPKASYQSLEQKLEGFQRMLGQVGGLQSKLDKLLASQNTQTQTQPEVLKNLTPEQDKATEELIEHYFKKKYGERWDETQAFIESAKSREGVDTAYTHLKSGFGAEFEKYEPILNNIIQSAKNARDSYGDPRASEFLNSMTTSPFLWAQAAKAMAQEQYAKTVQAKSAQALEAQRGRGAAAATSVPGSAKAPKGIDPNKMPIADLRALVEQEAVGG